MSVANSEGEADCGSSQTKYLNVASLNFYGLYISRHRATRLEALINHLLTSPYTAVNLQELWIHADYQYLAQSLASHYPYSFYFKSGVLGSGLATFSRYPIRDVQFQRFAVNGRAHRIWHGDWWSGKGVALCRIEVSPGVLLNLYNTHLHAEYDDESRKYLGHRMCQWYQLTQFIKQTKTTDLGSIVNVITGDFNSAPDCPAYEIFILKDFQQAGLHDSVTQESPAMNTSNTPDNSFTGKKKTAQRIDYIFYNGLAAPARVKVLQEDRLARQQTTSLSDHCLVSAIFDLSKPLVTEESNIPETNEEEVLGQLISVLTKDIHFTRKSKTVHVISFAVQLALFLIISIGISLVLTFSTLPVFVTLAAFIIAPGLLIGSLISLVIAFVWLPEELAHLSAFAAEFNLRLVNRGVAAPAVSELLQSLDEEELASSTSQSKPESEVALLRQQESGSVKKPISRPQRLLVDDLLIKDGHRHLSLDDFNSQIEVILETQDEL